MELEQAEVGKLRRNQQVRGIAGHPTPCDAYLHDVHAVGDDVVDRWRGFVTIGLLGSFTTFSTVGYETFALMRERELWVAAGNIVANVGIGVAAVWLGHSLVRLGAS